ncbi:MAG: hypothetical protein HQ547_07615 [Candidatus Omnitrophica bacterium]|nr:hypothetical protein [Candidatus Omnitrophota bacterium]
MGQQRRFQIRHQQKLKRLKKRNKLVQQKLNPEDFFVEGYYVGHKK